MAGSGWGTSRGGRLDRRDWIRDASTSNCPKTPCSTGQAAQRALGAGAQAPRMKRPSPTRGLGLLRRPREVGGGALSLLRVRLEFPPRATGAGVSLRSWTKRPAFAFRCEARGLWAEVTEGQAPCRGPGGEAAGTRHGPVFGAFHTFPPPGTSSGPKRLREQGGWGEPLCPRCLLSLFLPLKAPPPLSSRKSCAFPRSRKRG